MPPKQWGTRVSKSYGGGGAKNAITDELTREAQYMPSATTATSAAATAAPKTTALNQRPTGHAATASNDPRSRVVLETEVRTFIRKAIESNNLLGLPAPEIDSMVDLILSANSKKEVFDWCSTLCLEEVKAVEIINLREKHHIGSFSDGSSAAPQTATASPAATTIPTTSQAPQNAAGGKQSSGGNSATPSLQSQFSQKPPKNTSDPSGPKILNVGSNASTVTTNAAGSAVPLNNNSDAPIVGSGTKKRGANAKALANLSQLGGSSLVVGKFFECGCFAATHNFISNCLNCGRIFCEQEMPAKAAAVGSYAARAGGLTTESIMCYACGQDPNKNITFEIKMQQGLVDQMSANKAQKGYDEAVTRRDQLMQFARERAKRTTVVDDQGVGGIAYGTNTAWMTEDEVEQMEEANRKQRIAEMHQRTGAYRIHLDIVNQSVSLGCAPGATDSKGDAAATGSVGGGAAASSAATAPNAWGTAAIPTATPLGQQGDDAEVDGGEDAAAYDSEEEGARRVLPLPTLLQKLWYSAEDKNANGTNAASNGGKWDTTRVAGNDTMDPSTKAGPTALDLKPTTHRGMIASKRVQNDYFEDDDLAYRVEREDFIFKMKRALLEEGDEEEEGANTNGKRKKGADNKRSPQPTKTGPQIDRESFSQHGVGESDTLDIGSSNAIGAAMAAGGRVGDQGMCMSLHQPWASLLVAGIKIHEGRSWPSDFKGRLWIHAAAAKYSENEIESIEEQHRQFLRANGTEKEKAFPTNYPTSCLLGYVNVTEVIPIAEYNQRIPEVAKRQSIGDSGFVFMCEKGSRVLPFTLPMEGKHKIYKLERKVWNAARKQFGEE